MTTAAEVEDLVVTAPGVYDAIPDDVYHGDPVKGGSLSSSGARRLLPPGCPAVFQYERVNGRPDKAVFDFGHAAHRLVLGVGATITAVDADDWRTKAAKEQRAEIRAAGGVPVLAAELDVVKAMAAAIREHPIASALLTPADGTPEASLFWTDNRSGVTLRGRLDWLPNSADGRMIVVDYKSGKSADPQQFARAAANYGYHMQAPWYLDGVTALQLAEDVAFVFVVQEKTPPYLVSVIELDSDALRVGRARNRKAIDLYSYCIDTQTWPGYSDDVALVSLPVWATRTEDDEL